MNKGMVIGVVVILAAVFGWQLLKNGPSTPSSGSRSPRNVGAVESIHGIPYPMEAGNVRVLEKLAHVDVYLHEPVVAKKLLLTVTFHPGNTDSLAVGVRDSGFWLSYQPISLWDGSGERILPAGRQDWQTRTIVVPLTDKFQEPDQSIDVMFFAMTLHSGPGEDEGIKDTVDWQLASISAEVTPTVPSGVELKDYVRSMLARERAL